MLMACCSKRVFLLGPSHHVYLDGCALSRCSTYATPIGDISLDLDSELNQVSRAHRLLMRSYQPSKSSTRRASSPR